MLPAIIATAMANRGSARRGLPPCSEMNRTETLAERTEVIAMTSEGPMRRPMGVLSSGSGWGGTHRANPLGSMERAKRKAG